MKTLNLASVSDIHLGHRRNPARDIVKNLYAAFPDNAQTGELDVLCVVGDLFDDLLTAPNEALEETDPWIAYMLRLCAKHAIKLRILEGTPSHDWRQSERWNTIERVIQSGCDYKYVKDLSIEFIEDLDIHVLYVPDEWETTAEKTLAQVHELLRAKGLEQVDYAFMHGQFEYQLPPVVKAQKHSSEEYLKLVRHLIFIGHVHIHSSLDRIHAQGSFDRLTHGEESPKGHLRARVHPSGEYEMTFVENTGAKIFLTISCLGMTLEETLEQVDRRAPKLPEGSFVRIEADGDNPVLANMELLIRRYPTIAWSKLAREAAEEEAALAAADTEELYVPITLTKDNLGELLVSRVAAREVSEHVLLAVHEIIKEVL